MGCPRPRGHGSLWAPPSWGAPAGRQAGPPPHTAPSPAASGRPFPAGRGFPRGQYVEAPHILQDVRCPSGRLGLGTQEGPAFRSLPGGPRSSPVTHHPLPGHSGGGSALPSTGCRAGTRPCACAQEGGDPPPRSTDHCRAPVRTAPGTPRSPPSPQADSPGAGDQLYPCDDPRSSCGLRTEAAGRHRPRHYPHGVAVWPSASPHHPKGRLPLSRVFRLTRPRGPEPWQAGRLRMV